MIWITGTGTVFILIYIIATCRWGKQFFEDDIFLIRWMKSSGYYLYFHLVSRIYQPESSLTESKSYKRLQQLYVKKDISREWREYQAEKYALILAGILMMFCVGSAALVFRGNSEWISSYMLTRPEYGDSAKEYALKAQTEDGEQENIRLTLEAQIYSSAEVQKQFEAYFEVLKKKVKGSNESLQEVRANLDFEADPEWKEIDIIWRPSDYDLITEQGEVLLEQAQEGENEVSLYLIMTHAQYSRTFEIPLTIVKYPSDSVMDLQSYLVQAQENSLEEKGFRLPGEFDGKKIQYILDDDYNAAGFVLLIVTVVLLLLYRQYASVKEQCAKRERQMKADYPEIISKLLILIRAGMPVRSAWVRIFEDYQIQKEKNGQIHFALEEMGAAIKEMNTGTSEGQAYLRFGKRCEQHLYLKLGSILEQNLRKGSCGIAALLESERIQALEERRRQVRAEGELAGTKLMMPMMLLFAQVLIIIMVPALMSFGI